MDDLATQLAAPRPETFKNWRGVDEKAEYPKGKMLARCGDVFLIQTAKESFATVYCLDTRYHDSREKAAAEFGQACIHQAECAGLMK